MRLIVDIPDEVINRIVYYLPRENPRKAWTEKEKKQTMREWLEDTAYTEAWNKPTSVR